MLGNVERVTLNAVTKLNCWFAVMTKAEADVSLSATVSTFPLDRTFPPSTSLLIFHSIIALRLAPLLNRTIPHNTKISNNIFIKLSVASSIPPEMKTINYYSKIATSYTYTLCS